MDAANAATRGKRSEVEFPESARGDAANAATRGKRSEAEFPESARSSFQVSLTESGHE